MNALRRILLTGIVALAGGALFTLLQLPIPWLLGPMAAVLVGSRLLKWPLTWPNRIRDAGIVIVGYTTGLSLTPSALAEIVRQLPSMLTMTLALLALCATIAFALSKLTGVDFPTMMTGSIPGGLSQMVTLAEEFPGVDLTVVTFLQVTRLMMIIFCVPLLLYSPLLGADHAVAGAGAAPAAGGEAWAALFPNIWIFAPLCVLCAWAGQRLKLPTAFMLGPMIGTAAVHLAGLNGPALPSALLDLSQFMIGAHVGLMLHPEKLERKVRTIAMSVASGAILIAGSFGFSSLLTRIHAVSPATALLSLAPGGMDQMGIMAHEVGADLSVVSGYQTFRILFIYVVVASVLKVIWRFHFRQMSQSGR
jgi:hypothetical protein